MAIIGLAAAHREVMAVRAEEVLMRLPPEAQGLLTKAMTVEMLPAQRPVGEEVLMRLVLRPMQVMVGLMMTDGWPTTRSAPMETAILQGAAEAPAEAEVQEGTEAEAQGGTAAAMLAQTEPQTPAVEAEEAGQQLAEEMEVRAI